MQPGDVDGDLRRCRGTDARHRVSAADDDRGWDSRFCRLVSRRFTGFEAPMSRRIIPLIMCGGAGTRLWPASREVHPKQFLPLFGARSTFQDTLLRVSDAALFERPIVITNAAYRFMVIEQLAEIGLEADVLLEPMRRDSGPAIAAGAAFAQARDKEAIVLALAADHVVRDTAAFVAACREGLVAAEAGRIVTFGVQPERPATEYGYINPGEVISGEVRAASRNSSRSRIRRPPPSYIKAGYLWNSGNFMFRAAVLLGRISQGRCCERARRSPIPCARAGRDLGFVTLDAAAFGAAKSISIDYAVMEKTSRAAVVPVACGWSDVGSWHAVWELSDKDGEGNAARGPAVFEDSRNCNVVDRQGAGGAGRRRRSRGGRDAGCRAGVEAKGCQRTEAASCEAEDRCARGDRGSHPGAPALGVVPIGRQWRAPPGQAHHRQAGRPAVAAEAPSPRRALDRGAWARRR